MLGELYKHLPCRRALAGPTNGLDMNPWMITLMGAFFTNLETRSAFLLPMNSSVKSSGSLLLLQKEILYPKNNMGYWCQHLQNELQLRIFRLITLCNKGTWLFQSQECWKDDNLECRDWVHDEFHSATRIASHQLITNAWYLYISYQNYICSK